jgi:hypothetical protein
MSYPNLNEEITQMLLESRDVLIKVEESLDCNLDLVVAEMWE